MPCFPMSGMGGMNGMSGQGVKSWVNSLAFDGSGDHIEFSDNAAYSFGDGGSSDSPFSITGWFTLNSIGAGKNGLFSKSSSTSSGLVEYRLIVVTTGEVLFSLNDNNTGHNITSTTDDALEVDTVYAICVTYDGSGSNTGMTIYINGVAVDQTKGSAGTYNAMHNTTRPLRIGQDLWASGFNRNLDGQAWEWELWNNELSSANALNRAKRGGTTPTGRISGWSINEGTGTAVDDAEEVEDGTISGATWSMRQQ